MRICYIVFIFGVIALIGDLFVLRKIYKEKGEKMKKIKKISVRLSQEDYEKYKSDFEWCKKRPELIEFFGHNKIETFSDYIRLILEIGYLEF